MDAPSRIIQVVPRLGPYDGIGDYALNLARGLRERHGATTAFIEAGARPRGDVGGEFEVWRSESSADALAAALAKAGGATTPVLLHYVGYGYASRGAPLWLTHAVARSRQALRYRLGIVFHELYATGRPWQSAFWLGGMQKVVTRRLARACDGALLTREANRAWLGAAGALAGRAVAVLPVPSGVGEPASIAAFAARPATLVVWGSAAMKREVYETRWARVREACASLGVTGIVDVGAAAASYPQGTIPIERHGPLPAADVSRILGAARFGLVVYPPAFLAKSTLFAAYAAHGMVPLVLDDSGSVAMDGLLRGTQFLAVGQAPSRLDHVAAAARTWYAEHDLSRHVEQAWRMLAQVRP